MTAPTMPIVPVVPAIEVRRLTKRFGSRLAVQDVELTVPAGQTLVLWGANGAGKTTILRCLLGVLPYDGDVRIMGVDVRRRGKDARRAIGYVPQEIRLHLDHTVEETVRMIARLRHIAPAHAMAHLDAWGLTAAARQRVHTLSGGMKQKLALVAALLADPPVLLLDEPASSLDLQTRRELLEALERLAGEGKTLVLCSHRRGDIWRLANRVVLLEHGRIAADGPPATVAERVDARAMLSLTVPPERVQDAVQILRRHAFSVEHNGLQLWVMGAKARSVEPLLCLHQAGVPILDFSVPEEG